MEKQLNRRQLLAYAAGIAASSLLMGGCQASVDGNPKFVDYPFKLGVASGDPLPDGFVLWTRLVPTPYDISSMPQRPIQVSWQIALDAEMKNIVRTGVCMAIPENAHAVHADVSGMVPDTEYYYQFTAGGEQSPIGRTYTTPLIGSKVEQFRFAFGSCQDISGGYYAAYRDLVTQNPRLMIFTGDYIYESEYIGGFRRIPVDEAFLLNDYRDLYTRYKLDRNLQLAHAHCPWLVIMDDHEIDDNWGGSFTTEKMNPADFVKRKVAAFKAYYEHMPLRLSARVQSGRTRLYQNTVIGDLIQFSLLDCRQYRDTPACLDTDGTEPKYLENCAEAWFSERSMLGKIQETWLKKSLGAYGARWNALVQTSVMAPLDQVAGPVVGYNADGWDSFAATRQRILDWIKAKKISNSVALGGDIHAFYVGIINEIASDFETPALLSEFVTTSISSGGGGDLRYQAFVRAENPPLRFFENRVRGYILCDVSHEEWRVKLRKVENVMDPNSVCSTLQEFVVENSKAEIIQV